MKIKFTKLKNGLKVQPAEGPSFKLSMHMWDALKNGVVTVEEYFSYTGREEYVGDTTLVFDYSKTNRQIRYALETRRLAQKSEGRSWLFALTPLGLLVRDAIPRCPPKCDWHKAGTNKLSSPQKRALKSFLSFPHVSAIPLGEMEPVVARWAAPEARKTLLILESKGFLRRGIIGIGLSGGLQVLPTEGRPWGYENVSMVWSLTVEGSLMIED